MRIQRNQLLRNLLREIDFYLVTDSRLSKKGVLSDVRESIDAGCRILQYREKTRNTAEMVEEARAIGCMSGGRAIFLVNDRIDVALAVDADGVHLGQNDMPMHIAREMLGEERIIGRSVHNLEEAVEAERGGADYVGLGAIFDTRTKMDACRGIGPGAIRRIRGAIRIPIVAIGGITKANCGSVVENGADGVAAISAVVASDDVGREAGEFIRVIRKAKSRLRCMGPSAEGAFLP